MRLCCDATLYHNHNYDGRVMRNFPDSGVHLVRCQRRRRLYRGRPGPVIRRDKLIRRTLELYIQIIVYMSVYMQDVRVCDIRKTSVWRRAAGTFPHYIPDAFAMYNIPASPATAATA